MSEEVNIKAVATHRPYDEAFKRAAVAQWASGVPAKRGAEGLGITTESLRAWRRQLGRGGDRAVLRCGQQAPCLGTDHPGPVSRGASVAPSFRV